MAKDAVETMGGLLPDDAFGRDAVHVAVIAVVAADHLKPGQNVGLAAVEANAHGDPTATSYGAKCIGIVDPFLTEPVFPGSRFWLFLYPRTITGLTHIWTHPDLPAVAATGTAPLGVYATPTQKLASERWLRDFCEGADCPEYETLLAAAEKVADGVAHFWDPEYLHFNDLDAHGDIPPEFWDHVSIVLGKPIKGTRAKYFSCTC